MTYDATRLLFFIKISDCRQGTGAIFLAAVIWDKYDKKGGLGMEIALEDVNKRYTLYTTYKVQLTLSTLNPHQVEHLYTRSVSPWDGSNLEQWGSTRFKENQPNMEIAQKARSSLPKVNELDKLSPTLYPDGAIDYAPVFTQEGSGVVLFPLTPKYIDYIGTIKLTVNTISISLVFHVFKVCCLRATLYSHKAYSIITTGIYSGRFVMLCLYL